ncbi:MAG: 30S ribosomal protein S17e [Nanoarchaeota archaeon]
MGRIKTSKIKRASKDVMKAYPDAFTDNYEENKQILQSKISVSSKKLKNIIAGYITRLTKNQEKL